MTKRDDLDQAVHAVTHAPTDADAVHRASILLGFAGSTITARALAGYVQRRDLHAA